MKPVFLSICIALGCFMTSCKQTVLTPSTECGDPPPGPPRVPEMRIIDKQTGKDYFIVHTSAKTPSFSYACNAGKAIHTEKYPLQNGNTTYGYIISTDAVVAYADQTNLCYKLVMQLDNETDTIQYMYHIEQPCKKATLWGAYSRKSGQLIETADSVNNKITYYTLLK